MKEYCPMVFRRIRERFGIDDKEYAVRCLATMLPMFTQNTIWACNIIIINEVCNPHKIFATIPVES